MFADINFGDGRYKVSNLEAAKEFYARAFGVEPYFDEPTWVIFQIHDYKLWLEPDDMKEESVYESTSILKPSRHLIHFWMVEDVQKIADQFRKLGGTIVKAPKRDRSFTVAIVKDPWNNKLGLHSKLFTW